MNTVMFVASIILHIISILLCALYVLIAITDYETIERTTSSAPRKMLRTGFISSYVAVILSCVFDASGNYAASIARASTAFKWFAITWLIASVLHIVLTGIDYFLVNSEESNVKFLAKVLLNMIIAMFVAALFSALLH